MEKKDLICILIIAVLMSALIVFEKTESLTINIQYHGYNNTQTQKEKPHFNQTKYNTRVQEIERNFEKDFIKDERDIHTNQSYREFLTGHDDAILMDVYLIKDNVNTYCNPARDTNGEINGCQGAFQIITNYGAGRHLVIEVIGKYEDFVD